MSSRKVIDLAPDLQQKFMLFATKMAEMGIPFKLTCTRRTQMEQNLLYEQGRTLPGSIVTWTRDSKHLHGQAFDIAIVKDGKPIWDEKVDVNKDQQADYIQAGIIGEGVGLTWGGRFKSKLGKSKPDYPHFEI